MALALVSMFRFVPVSALNMLPHVQGGLAVVDAKFGALEAITKAEVEERERASSSRADATSAADVAASTEQQAGTSAGVPLFSSYIDHLTWRACWNYLCTPVPSACLDPWLHVLLSKQGCRTSHILYSGRSFSL